MSATSSDEAKIKLFDIPGPEFDIESASLTDLSKHGLPIGKNSRERALITRALSKMRGRLRFAKPEFEILPPRGRLLQRTKRKSPGIEESELAFNWAGVVNYAQYDDPVRWVTTEFTVPNVAGTAPGTAGNSAHWVGIDGATEDLAGQQLCQCGVECDNTPGKEQCTPYVWIEWVPGPMIRLYSKTFLLSPGDLLGVTLCTAGRGATTATAYFYNVTTGVALTPVQIQAPPGVSLSGETVEWISERPKDLVSGEFFQLGNFGSVVFCECNAGTASGAALPAAESGVYEMSRSADDNTLLCECTVPTLGMVRTIWMLSE